MEAALATLRNPPGHFRRSLKIPQRTSTRRTKHILFCQTSYRQSFVSCSIKMSNAEQSKPPQKVASYLHILSERLRKSLPEQAKEIPWKRVEDLAMERLVSLGQVTLKWSLAAFVVTSFISDVFLSFSRNMELMIPLGLLFGVMIAEFLKETSEELFESRKTIWHVRRRLIGIGSLFVLIKFGLLYFTSPGKMFLSHVCNGGLMQLFWLMKKFTEANDGDQSEVEPLLSSSEGAPVTKE